VLQAIDSPAAQCAGKLAHDLPAADATNLHRVQCNAIIKEVARASRVPAPVTLSHSSSSLTHLHTAQYQNPICMPKPKHNLSSKGRRSSSTEVLLVFHTNLQRVQCNAIIRGLATASRVPASLFPQQQPTHLRTAQYHADMNCNVQNITTAAAAAAAAAAQKSCLTLPTHLHGVQCDAIIREVAWPCRVPAPVALPRRGARPVHALVPAESAAARCSSSNSVCGVLQCSLLHFQDNGRHQLLP
jgi:hypothetical protein